MPTSKTTTSLDDAASSLSRSTNASTRVSYARANTIDLSEFPPAKRRKVAGLNSRFDRMIKSVDAMLSDRTGTPASSRKRMQSSSTSSVSSHGIPKTPVDVYSNLHPRRLGSDFSVLKLKKSAILPREDVDRFPKPAAPPRKPKSPLPDWLADTFCSLEPGHPLRALLSPSRINLEFESDYPPVESPGASNEEKVFAFSPFDKQEEALYAPYRTETDTMNLQDVLSVPKERIPSQLELEASTNPLPFSTPGCFASVRRSTRGSTVDGIHKPLVPAQQMTFHITNTMHPPASPTLHLRSNDVIGRSQLTQGFPNLVQNNGLPSDLQEHVVGTNHRYQAFPGGCDNLNVYATPGPTFACSRPVYFNSPTEDPSLSDPLQPESYQLDLNAIDFHWHPFLRSHTPENDENERPVSAFSLSGYSAPNKITSGGRTGWNVRSAAEKGEYGASSEDLPRFAEEVDITYFDDISAIRPSNEDTTGTKLTISNTTGPWSPINDVQQVRTTFPPPGMFLSPLRGQPEPALLTVGSGSPRGDGRNIHRSEEPHPLHGRAARTVGSKAHGVQPSTPVTHVRVSPPGTPQKLRPSQLCEAAAPRTPVRKTSSALSWMIPLKPPKKNITAVGNDIDRCVSVNSHDSIESWSE